MQSLKFFLEEPFFSVLQITCLSKCPYFEKPPLTWKFSGYAHVKRSKTCNWTPRNFKGDPKTFKVTVFTK